MSRRIYWLPKELEVNFNYCQWRQDLAHYIQNKLFMWGARVTKSKQISKNDNLDIKEFQVYEKENVIIVQYANKNKIIYTNKPDLLKEYLKQKGIDYE